MYNISLERYSYSASAHIGCIKIHADMTEILQFYYATIAYHVGLNAVLGWPPGPANV